MSYRIIYATPHPGSQEKVSTAQESGLDWDEEPTFVIQEPTTVELKDLAATYGFDCYNAAILPRNIVCTTPLDDAVIAAVIHGLYDANNNGLLANSVKAWYFFKFDVEGSVPHQLYDITVWGASISHHLTEYAHVQPIAKPKANEFVAKCCVVGDRVICGNT